jgi:hypothetical protein
MSEYHPKVLEAGARALAARADNEIALEDFPHRYVVELMGDVAAVLDAAFAPDMAGWMADELERRLYPEGARRAAVLRDGFPAGQQP